METKKKTCFWEEISKYNILIPNYQRDYAQGRIDNSKIDSIRRIFVSEKMRNFYAASSQEQVSTVAAVFVP